MFGLFFFGCGTSQSVSIDHYYDYDANYPLRPEVKFAQATDVDSVFHVTYKSVNRQRVPALLSLSVSGKRPYPAIIFLHGLGDNKSADYMEFGDRVFAKAGYAVFRIDYALHGERRDPDFTKFDLRKPYPFTTRNAIVQTVFDLRRAVDYLQTRGTSTKTGLVLWALVWEELPEPFFVEWSPASKCQFWHWPVGASKFCSATKWFPPK